MKRPILFVVCAAAVLTGLTLPCWADSPIVINELMYDPLDGEDADEYVELYNAGYGSVDLSDWRFSDGIDFTFPQGTVLDEGEYLVVCKDLNRVGLAYGINNAIGNYDGTLSDSGERVRLVNSVGMVMDEVEYRDRNPWPAGAGRTGYSLELRNPAYDNDTSSSWFASIVLFGTPGARNSVFFDPGEEVVTLIKPGDLWRFFRGWVEPSNPIEAWRQLDFDDQSWEEGPSGFGAGDGDDATELTDMQNNYVSVYIRKEFTVDDATAVANVRLTVDYDDGFVAYLNGEEIRRRGMGEPGTPVYYDTFAASHEAGTPEGFDLGSLPGLLCTGRNVLAIECHNESYTNGDLSLIPSLEIDFSSPLILINEFQCDPDGWVELFNPSSEAINIGGYYLTDNPADLLKYRIPDGTTVEGNGFAAFDKAQLGFLMPSAGGGLYLVAPNGRTVVDAFTFGQQHSGMSYGRYPDGSSNWYFLDWPTKEQPNKAQFRNDVIINEIMFHPQYIGDEEFIELYNRGNETVSLDGWKLAGAIRFAFPAGVSIAPGEYLVIASSVAAFSAKYGFAGVLGDYSGKLRNYGEKIVLLDAIGNPADEVFYADEAPWPAEADGLGPSLELMYPDLDNSFGQLWAASDSETAPEGTPGTQNSTFGTPIPPAIVQTRHSPVVPGSGDTVTISTRVIDDGSVVGVTLFVRRDGEGQFSQMPMVVRYGGSPNDAVYDAEVQAQTDGTLMQFYIQAADDESNVSSFPAEAPAKTCLYLVDDTTEPADLPLYRVLLTNANYTELRTRDVDSNVLLDGTFTCGGQAWYNVGLRYRGYGSRGIGEPNMSYRVQFNDGQPFGKVRKLNLNGQRPASQAVGWETMRRAGMPYSETKLAYLKLNDSFRGVRLQVESVDADYLRRVFPEDSSGNLYRGEGHAERTGVNYGADFSYHGETPAAYAPYQKQTNEVENDFTDIIHLCDVFSNTPDDEFEQAISELINVEEWILYFAINTCFNNLEGAIYLDTGDDYYIYHYPYDDKWYIIPWDLDTILTDPTETIFRQRVPSIVRLLSVPRFRLMYLRQLEHLIEYEFSERQMFPAIDSFQGKFSAATLQGYKDVVTGRIADIRSQIVTELTIAPPGIGVEYIHKGDEWWFFRGKAAPSNPADAWKELGFDPAAAGWEKGPSGFGYGDGDDATVLSDMQNHYLTVYIRKEFTVPSAAEVAGLELEIDYDDGFVAYLNGTKVAEGNMGSSPWSFNTPAANGNHEAGTPEKFDLTEYLWALSDGTNVLAVEGHNGSLGSSDLSLIPELRSIANVVQNEGRWIVGQENLTLTGTAPITLTEAVTVNGNPADYDLGRGEWSYEISLSPGANVVTVAAIGSQGMVVDTKQVEIVFIPPDRMLRGELTGNSIWTKAMSPYVIAETVYVPTGVVLTVEAGTEVLVANGKSLVVAGELLADGTESDPVVFTRYKDGETWGVLAFDGASPSRLTHCVVEFSFGVGSYAGNNYGGAVSIQGSDLDVDGCIFRNLPDESPTAQGPGINLTSGASAEIRNSYFSCMGAGVHTEHNYVLVENCVFSDIHGSGNDPVDVNGETTPSSVVRNNVFLGSEDDGIDMDGSSPLIAGNFVYSSADKGISVSSGSNPRIENNVVVNNGTGIAVTDGSNAFIVNNTIVNNGTGLDLFEKTAGQGGGAGTVVNCILWGNGTEILQDGLSAVAVSYSAVSGDPVWPGEGNINADPLFVDGANNDFHLTKLSPCVDSGSAQDAPAGDVEGNTRPCGGGFDMGAYESLYWSLVDTDGDGMSDAWEEHYFASLAQGADDDFDDDGMKNLAEYDMGADPTKSDTDGDGMPDGWEVSYGLSPVSSEGSDGPQSDVDGDGMTNYEEYLAGTSPTDGSSVFGVEEVIPAGGTAGLRWHARVGREYRVLASSDLQNWSEVASIGPGGDRQAEWVDNNSNGEPRQFYKLEALP
jgi:parallel beta-helix repeat protein